METIEDLMIELDGADAETINRIAWEKGSLPVRLAMLGLASLRKGDSPLWWSYPPGVFISYKWDGALMRNLALELAGHVRESGYRAFLDVENLSEDADAYFQIPQFIALLQDCTFYVLLLTEASANQITVQKNKTTWLYDEYQHALRLANSGRLLIVPVLLESKGMTDFYTSDTVIDLTGNQRGFGALDNILTPQPIALNEGEIEELATTVAQFDAIFLNEHWEESDNLLRRTEHLGHTFDYQFRRLLHSLYTADKSGFDAAFARLNAIYGTQIVLHFYKGYCTRHNIPIRISLSAS